MKLVSLGLVFIACWFVEAQHQIELQFIGSEVSAEEQSKENFCESKYCVLDSNYLFLSATQNKSVKPCEDFKEFALGTFIKYRAISDRKPSIGFYADNDDAYNLRLRKMLAAKENEKDTRVTKAMKKLYAKCVNSNYVRHNAVNEMRDYVRSFGLKFYPDTDQDDFVISKYFEGQPFHAIYALLQCSLARTETHLKLEKVYFYSLEDYFTSYESMLYEINQVYLNNSANAEKFKEEFKEISRKQAEFYKLQQSFVTDDSEDEAVFMTFEELNELTSILNLDWFKIINNQLLTKTEANEKIYVESPQTIRKLVKFLASADKKSIADYLVYDFMYSQAELVVVYKDDKWEQWSRSVKKSLERWDQCVEIFSDSMNPALMFLFFAKYGDEKQQKSIQELIRESIDFAVKKIEAEARWEDEVNKELINRVSSIKLVAGYPDGFLEPKKIEELYANLRMNDDQKFVNMTLEIKFNHQKELLEPLQSERRKLIDSTVYYTHNFQYSPYDDIMFIHVEYLHYPFYHYQRPRFFNSATVSYFFFSALNVVLSEYLETKYKINDFDIFADELQIAYEFYDDWLKHGGIDLQLGANRLTSQQLFWVAAAKVYYEKFRPTNSTEETEDDEFDNLHEIFFKKPGFQKGFHCNNSNDE